VSQVMVSGSEAWMVSPVEGDLYKDGELHAINTLEHAVRDVLQTHLGIFCYKSYERYGPFSTI
jgi:hypothetical protein